MQINGGSKLTLAPNGGLSVGAYNNAPPANGLYVTGDITAKRHVSISGHLTIDTYKTIGIGNAGGDYTKTLILLHEIYDGRTLIDKNFVTGTITAMRGSAESNNRTNTVYITTSSAYSHIHGSLKSMNTDQVKTWKLVTLNYGGKKYMAVELPYRNDRYSLELEFSGWSSSTAESFKIIDYETKGVAISGHGISNKQAFAPNMIEHHAVKEFNVGGVIKTQEVVVTMDGWADFVFDQDYKLPSLQEVEAHISKNGHLPGIPTEAEVKENGISVGEMNAKLLQKIEELTLYIIEQQKEIEALKDKVMR